MAGKSAERLEQWEWEHSLPSPSCDSNQDGHPKIDITKADTSSAEGRYSAAHSGTTETELSRSIPDSSGTCQKERTPIIGPKASIFGNTVIRYPTRSLSQRNTRKPLWAWVFVVLSLIFGITETIIAVYFAKILLTPDPLGVGGYLFLLFSPLIAISIVLAILQLRASYYVLKIFKDNIPRKLTILSAILNAPIILVCIGFFILPIVCVFL